MISRAKRKSYGINGIRVFINILVLLFCITELSGQEPPPRPLSVTVTAQGLSFGAFSQGATGGTVTVDANGSRNATGDVILLSLGFTFSAALYELVANPGTVVSLLNGPDVLIPGSNGGSILLHIGSSNPASPFVIATQPPVSTLLYVGGVLTVGNPASNPAGSYSGTFNITFIQE